MGQWAPREGSNRSVTTQPRMVKVGWEPAQGSLLLLFVSLYLGRLCVIIIIIISEPTLEGRYAKAGVANGT